MTIIYSTNAGSTERYAKMLSEKLSCPAVKINKAGDIDKNEEVIFMSWLMSGTLQDYSKAKEMFSNIRAVCAVGLFTTEDKLAEVTEKNAIDEELFFLHGAFNINNLTGMYKMMMGMAMKMIKAKLKESNDPKANEMADMFEKGIDLVKEEELDKVVEFLNA